MFPIMTLFHKKQINKQFMAFKIINDFGPELTREKYIHFLKKSVISFICSVCKIFHFLKENLQNQILSRYEITF